MKKTYDLKSDSAYFYLNYGANSVVETTELSDSILVDLDSLGRPVGIEVLNATEILPKKTLRYLERNFKSTVR